MAKTINVLCAGAVKSPVTAIAQGFEENTGNKVGLTFGPVGALKAKLLAGEPADIVILSRPVLEQLVQEGKLLGQTISELGRVGVGITVRSSTVLPDVSTPDALRRVLLAAKSIAYGDPAKGDSSGVHFASVLKRLGIEHEVKERSVLAAAGLAVAELVKTGEVAIGATQATVISACEGVLLAGLLPADLQHITTYALALVADEVSSDTAAAFAAYMNTSSAKAQLERAGLIQ